MATLRAEEWDYHVQSPTTTASQRALQQMGYLRPEALLKTRHKASCQIPRCALRPGAHQPDTRRVELR